MNPLALLTEKGRHEHIAIFTGRTAHRASSGSKYYRTSSFLSSSLNMIQAFPHHFLVLRRGINPNIVEHLSPIKGISTSYGYHPSKRMRPVIVEKAPKSPSDFKEPVGGGADSVSFNIWAEDLKKEGKNLLLYL